MKFLVKNCFTKTDAKLRNIEVFTKPEAELLLYQYLSIGPYLERFPSVSLLKLGNQGGKHPQGLLVISRAPH
jgi:hypothetical protein